MNINYKPNHMQQKNIISILFICIYFCFFNFFPKPFLLLLLPTTTLPLLQLVKIKNIKTITTKSENNYNPKTNPLNNQSNNQPSK